MTQLHSLHEQAFTSEKMTERLVLVSTDKSLFTKARSVLGSSLEHIEYRPEAPSQLGLQQLLSGDDRYVSSGAHDVIVLDLLHAPTSSASAAVAAAQLIDAEGQELLIVSPKEVEAEEDRRQERRQHPSELLGAINVLRDEVGDDYRWLEQRTKESCHAAQEKEDVSQLQAGVRYHDFSSEGGSPALAQDPCGPNDDNLDYAGKIVGRYRAAIEASANATSQVSVVFISIPPGKSWETLCLLYVQELISIMRVNAENYRLRNTVDAMRASQVIVPSPSPAILSLPPIETPVLGLPRYGDDVLIIIPTENKSKRRCLEESVLSQNTPSTPPGSGSGGGSGSGRAVHFLSLAADSNVGEQPYNGAGAVGASNRIRNVLASVSANLEEYETLFRQWRVGTVIVACVESFIQTENPVVDVNSQGAAVAVDHGLVAFYNARTNQAVVGVSRGVTVPKRYVDRARRFGVEHGDPDHGRVTVGRVLAANVPGLDKADWHSVLAGCSRYDLLKEAAGKLEIPW